MGRRWTRPGHFRPDEVDRDATAGVQARLMATARELEWLAITDDIAPGAGFVDRVMTAIAAEPTPRPFAAAASAARRGAILGVIAAFGDLWRVAWTGGRPMSVRAPAMLLVVVLFAASLGAGALGVGALGGLLDRPGETALPPQVTTATPEMASPSPSPSASPNASESPEPSETPEASGTPAPSETPDAATTPDPTPKTATARPTAAPRPTPTAEHTEAPKPSPSPTPEHTEAPKPSPSPEHGD